MVEHPLGLGLQPRQGAADGDALPGLHVQRVDDALVPVPLPAVVDRGCDVAPLCGVGWGGVAWGLGWWVDKRGGDGERDAGGRRFKRGRRGKLKEHTIDIKSVVEPSREMLGGCGVLRMAAACTRALWAGVVVGCDCDGVVEYMLAVEVAWQLSIVWGGGGILGCLPVGLESDWVGA